MANDRSMADSTMSSLDREHDKTARKLGQLLGGGIDAATELRAILKRERLSLEQRDLEALESAASDKAVQLETLADFDRQREALCKQDGTELSVEKLTRSAATADGLRRQWQQLLDLAAECKALNLANGSVIHTRQIQLGDRLAALRGMPQGPVTYSETGGQAAQAAQRSLTEA